MSLGYLGEIRIFAGSFAPAGWAACEGQLLPISQNEALFSLLGTMWGGDGRTNFQLPDFRDRLVVGSGSGPGLAPRSVAQTGGASTVTIDQAQIPPHTHVLMATTDPATSESPTAGAMLAAAASPTAPAANVGLPYIADIDKAAHRVLAADTVSSPDKNSSHNNEMPALAVTYIIALSGIYPMSE